MIQRLTFLIVLMIVTAWFPGCTETNMYDYTFSFEDGLESWSEDGTDLDNPPVDWTVALSDEMSSEGDYAIKLYLNNVNDAGKIWLERSFDLEPNRTYNVEITYDFASADFGDFNLWQIITGVSSEEPEAADDLMFQGDTGIGEQEGFIWLDKSYEFTAESNDDGELWVALGVWGTWETPRTYYIDNISISFIEQ